jgi:hypothetical protein
VPGRRLPGSPRATRAMVDLLYSIAACDDLVGSWELSGQPGGLLVRVRTRESFESEPQAIEAAERMVKCVLPSGGGETESSNLVARAVGSTGDRWRGAAEVMVAGAD